MSISTTIDSGDLPSAEGVAEGHDLAQVVKRWQSIAHGRFRDDCRFLLQMIEETDRLRLWEKNVGGFTFKDRDEFLQKKVLIDYDLTEQQTRQIVAALKEGKSGGVDQLLKRGAPQGNKNAAKGKNKGDNLTFDSRPKKKVKRGTDPDYIKARLARDKDDQAQPEDARERAGFLLAGIERGEIKPYKAAKAMGYVKAPDPVAIVEKQREKLEPEEQVRIWEEWGRALPDGVIDRVEVAKEALLNLHGEELTDALGVVSVADLRAAVERMEVAR